MLIVLGTHKECILIHRPVRCSCKIQKGYFSRHYTHREVLRWSRLAETTLGPLHQRKTPQILNRLIALSLLQLVQKGQRGQRCLNLADHQENYQNRNFHYNHSPASQSCAMEVVLPH
jgi:hypothetical protein